MHVPGDVSPFLLEVLWGWFFGCLPLNGLEWPVAGIKVIIYFILNSFSLTLSLICSLEKVDILKYIYF